MFLTVFLLFQGVQVGKQYWNQYEKNLHWEETSLRSGDLWNAGGRSGRALLVETPGGAVPPMGKGTVLFVGDPDGAEGRTAAVWAGYNKRELKYAASLEDLDLTSGPDMILLEGSQLPGNAGLLDGLLEDGIDLVCMDLPETETLSGDRELLRVLGIRAVYARQVTLDGIHLFSGFLLGGERIYQATRPEEEELRDLELSCPWFIVRVGTKTYLQGILGEEDAHRAELANMKNEDMPALIWRNARGKGQVYVVNGGYMADTQIGAGLLNAIVAERQPFALYPVVNAQLYTFLNYPEGANENSQVIRSIYGNEQVDVEKNILLPVFTSLVSRYNMRLTFGMAPQLDYEDENEPEDGFMGYFLSNFNEMDGEAILSLYRRGDTDLKTKLDRDGQYAGSQEREYRFSAVCAPGETLEEVRAHLDHPMLKGVRTVIASPLEGREVVGYLAGNVTLQQITSTAEKHTYTNDLELLGLETALGYSNTGFDMASILWPASDEDQWQKKSRTVLSNVTTYGAPFKAFDNRTASEGDARVRRFLNLDYAAGRVEDTVFLTMEGFQQEAFFVLRTHDEEIVSAVGAEWTEIEAGAYLISAAAPQVELTLQSSIHMKRG